MSAPFRLILSPKCSSPLSPVHQHLAKSLAGRQGSNNLAKKLDFLASPSKPEFTNLIRCNYNNNNQCPGEIKLTVPEFRKGENGLVVNTPQKNSILKNGLPEKSALNILGRGTFGTVVRGVYKSKAISLPGLHNVIVLADRDVAVKVIKHDAKRKLRESNVLGLSHPNIVRTLDIVTSQNQNHAMVIMEYLGKSRQLQGILDDKSFELKEGVVAKIALDVCSGLLFCHENGILHLDVKPSNILVCENGNCKLCDFGSCFEADAQEKPEPYIHQGTVAYTGPEILLGEKPTIKADVYSFGILLWQLVHRRIPYENIERSEIIIYKVVKFGLRPSCLLLDGGGGFDVLYKQCWATLPKDRPDMQTVINSLRSLVCLV